MKRRALLKSLLALLVCSALGTAFADGKKASAGTQTTLQIILDGPFAVFHKDQSPTITVFSHMFSNHGIVINSDSLNQTDKKHSISLIDNGAIDPPRPQFNITDHLLDPFTFHSTFVSSGTENLVEMVLPTPDSIISDDANATHVMFEDHITQADMQQGIILQYVVTGPTKQIFLIDSLTRKSYKSVGLGANLIGFKVEVGLLKFDDVEPDMHGVHASAFHNDQLQDFPALKNDPSKRLLPISGPLSVVRVPRKQRVRKGQRRPTGTTTTVECKIGGFIVTDP